MSDMLSCASPAPLTSGKQALLESDIPHRKRATGTAEPVREALVRAGQKLFSEHAVDAVAIHDIVREAGVAQGSFYKYFPDKEALLAAVTGRICDRVEAEVAAANAEISDPARRVVRGICIYLRFVADQAEQGGVLVRNDRMGATVPAMELSRGTTDDVSVGLAQGRFSVSSVEAGALFIFGVAHAGLTRFNGDRGGAAKV